MKNIFSSAKTILRWLLTRVGGLYLFCGLLLFVLVDPGPILHHARGTTLSRIIPDFSPLRAFDRNGAPLTQEQWYTYRNYFHQVLKFKPDQSDVYGLLGYSYFYSGDLAKAEKYIRQAVEAKPGICSFNYNLGVIYYRKGEHRKALECLRAALNADLVVDMNYVTSSRAYFVLIDNVNNVAEEVTEKLRRGYKNALMLAISCALHMEDYQSMLVLAKSAIKRYLFDDAYFHFYGGLAAYQLGMDPEAIYFFRQAVRTDMELAENYYFLGTLLQKSVQAEYAAPLLKQYLLLKGTQKNSALEIHEMLCRNLGLQIY